MSENKFEINLLRFIGAELYFSLSLQTSREMYWHTSLNEL
jgi:hypothetical protein